MRKRLKRIITSFSAATFAATSLCSVFASQAHAENEATTHHYITESEHIHECSDADCGLHFDDHCHDSDSNSGNGIAIALLDAGVTEFNVAEKISFIEDDTIDSAHGNDMMHTLLSIAPYADIFDIRVLDDNGIGSYADVEKGIRWAVDNDADIIVMSFAGKDTSSLIENALIYAEENNVLVVAAAGNNSSTDPYYPAAYPGVISVGATDSEGSVQEYSNYGDFVDTYVQCEDGTSGAAQFIAATSAIIKQNDPDITLSELRASFGADKNAVTEISSSENADSLVYACACKTHDYSVFKMTAKAATCTSDGVGIYQCSRCTSTTNKTIPAYGHRYGSWSTESYATCDSGEIQKRKCSNCYGVERRTIGSPLGHDYSNFKMNAVAATCTSDGVAIYECTRCTSTQSRNVPAYGHYWTDWDVESYATCDSGQVNYHQCYNCSMVERETVTYPLGHDYSVYKMAAKPVTCTADGVGIYQCSRCDSTESRTLPAYGHKWGDWETESGVSCTSGEVQIRKCPNCLGVERQTIGDPLGHDYSVFKLSAKPVTCTTDGVGIYQCSRCDSTESRELPAYGHKWGEWETESETSCTSGEVQIRKCPNCSGVERKTIGDPLGHDYSVFKLSAKPVTCTADGVGIYQCSRCDSTTSKTLPATGHKWGDWEDESLADCTSAEVKIRKCPNCLGVERTTVGSPLGHDYSSLKITAKAATCTTDGVGIFQCTRCTSTTEKTIPAFGHKWGSWETTSYATCTEARVRTRKCTICTKVSTQSIGLPLGHDYSVFKMTAKPVTCTTDGVGIYQCSRCTSTTEKNLPAYDHKYSWQLIKAATCTEPGELVYKCPNCLSVKNEIPLFALGHKLETEYVSATTDSEGYLREYCTRNGCTYETNTIIPAVGDLSVLDYDADTFYLRSDGTVDPWLNTSFLQGTINDKTYLQLYVTSNVDWTITSDSSTVHFMDSDGAEISGGNSGDTYVYVKMDMFPFDLTDPTREAHFTIRANDKLKTYTLSQFNRSYNGLSKADYVADVTNKYLAPYSFSIPSNSNDAKILRGDIVTNGSVEVISLDSTKYLAISAIALDEGMNEIAFESIEFIASKALEGNALDPMIKITDTNNLGMKIVKGSSPMIQCTFDIDETYIDVTDPKYEENLRISKCITVPLNAFKDIYIGYSFPDLDSTLSYLIGLGTSGIIDGAAELIVDHIHSDLGDDGVLNANVGFSISDGCNLSRIGDNLAIHASTLSARQSTENDISFSFVIENSHGNQRIFSK